MSTSTTPTRGRETSRLVTEFEIRRRWDAALADPASPGRRARSLLRLARQVYGGALAMSRLGLSQQTNGNGEGAQRFRAASARLMELHEEIRCQARDNLAQERRTPAA